MRRMERAALAVIAGLAFAGWAPIPALAAPEVPQSTVDAAAASASRTNPRQDPARPSIIFLKLKHLSPRNKIGMRHYDAVASMILAGTLLCAHALSAPFIELQTSAR